MKKSTTRLGALALTGVLVGSGVAGAFVSPAFAAPDSPKPDAVEVTAEITEATGPANCLDGSIPIRITSAVLQDWVWDEADDGGTDTWIEDPAGTTGGDVTDTTRDATVDERAAADCGPGADDVKPDPVTTAAAYDGPETLDCEAGVFAWTHYGAESYDWVWDVPTQSFVPGETAIGDTEEQSRPATAEDCEEPGGGEEPGDGGEEPGDGGEEPGDGGGNPGGEEPGDGGEEPGDGGENPGGENPGGENPGGENPGGENPGGENPGTENPGTENPGTENPGAEAPKPANTVPAADAVAGEDFRVTGSGFKANEVVKVYLHSDPILLGELTADADGKIDGYVKIPANAPAGEHHIVLVDTAGVEYQSGTITVKAAAAAAVAEEGHPDTGFGLAGPLTAALTLIAAGGVFLVARKRGAFSA
ncbi:hypothetical protein [Agromyces humi]|uniref:hypothetical protein n=1 Tax=Agromyces humi TaxID=1766800 RepID=UPI0013575C75|nr:hypothetical protein [Agromyces humi]